MDSLLKSFIRNSIFPVSLYDRDMRLLLMSDAWSKMYGLTENSIGQIHYDTFLDLPPHWIEAHQAALRGKKSEHIEEPYRLANGAFGWHRWQCLPWFSPEGEIKGLLISAEDVTKRKERELEVRKVVTRFELIQQAAQIGMWDWDISEKNITLNAEYYEILGVPVGSQVNYQDFTTLIHPDDLRRVSDGMGKALNGEDDYEEEFRIIRRGDGKVRWVKDKGRVEFDDDGNPIRAYGAIVDVTKLRVIEHQHLRSTGEDYNKYLASIPAGLSVVDRLGVIVYANKKLSEMLGYSEDEMIGKSLYNFIDNELRRKAKKNLDDRLDGNSNQHLFRVKHRDGSDIWLLISGQPVVEDGEIVGSISIHMNYSDQKRVDADKDKRIGDLERLLAFKK